MNGVTYYYRVSASNALGEGPLSSEVSATPAGFEPPFEPLTTLDTFNRADENPLSDGGRWGNGVIGAGEGPLRLLSGQLAGTKTTTTTGWRTNASYGPDVEVWTRLTTLPGTPNSVRLYARLVQPGSGAAARLHAPHHAPRRHRSGPARTSRQRRDRDPRHPEPGARDRRPPAPAVQG